MTAIDLLARLERVANERSGDIALVCGRRDGSGQSLRFAELYRAALRTVDALCGEGVERGHRAVVMTQDPFELAVVICALLRLGAVPVLIDPGLPRADLRACLDEVAPEVFIGQPAALLARRVLGWANGHVRIALATRAGRPLVWARALPIGRPVAGAVPEAPPVVRSPAPDDLAMIAFTSGSTGRPKGVEYHYSTLTGQLDALEPLLAGSDRGPLLSGFLPFVLFGPALGLTTIAPAVSHRAPARTPPQRVLRPLLDHRASTVVASPAVLSLLAEHCARRGLVLSSVNRVLSFGAPLHRRLADLLHRVLRPDAEVLSVYGATECLPVSAVSTARLREGAGGSCVGRPLPGLSVRVLEADATGVGEIAVAGPNVSVAYHSRPEATAAAKLAADCGLLHRTGDLGRFDEQDRLWFHGRKAHRVTGSDFTLCTEEIEAATGRVPVVRRTALVGIGPAGQQRAVLCAELEPGRDTGRESRCTARQLLSEALALVPGGQHVEALLIHPRFPTDIRHNSKIDRVHLATWAAQRLGSTS
ncbi:AMP-binding protein [Kitasatospora viridis]|uniref:Acyl-CoA synthetase (AMP-forming)/AMP-acid ligase II n=1 Tax=Kitasatospora viridis TaxID=281105 RepID=A0A561TW27_9ACTN|nr:AMP-binding protein [Kitasatospora viridis]TWF91311.1 acyl-CoA synthetase (AMP-forming)/AMP-acid ligase II [Kitasatospora viridis]